MILKSRITLVLLSVLIEISLCAQFQINKNAELLLDNENAIFQNGISEVTNKEHPKHFAFTKFGVISGNSFQVGYSRKFFKSTYVSFHAEMVTYNAVGVNIWELSSPEDWVNRDPDKRTYLGLRIGRQMNLSSTGRSSFHLSGGWAYIRDHITLFDQAVYANNATSPEFIKSQRNHVGFIFTTEFQKWYGNNIGAIIGFSGGLFDNNHGDFLLNFGVKFALPKKN